MLDRSSVRIAVFNTVIMIETEIEAIKQAHDSVDYKPISFCLTNVYALSHGVQFTLASLTVRTLISVNTAASYRIIRAFYFKYARI